MAKIQYGRWGLAHDPRGWHCTLKWQGRILIGEIEDAYFDGVRGATRLKVSHFNGDPWPLDPVANVVDVLERREP